MKEPESIGIRELRLLDHLPPDPAGPGERPLSEVLRGMRDEER